MENSSCALASLKLCFLDVFFSGWDLWCPSDGANLHLQRSKHAAPTQATRSVFHNFSSRLCQRRTSRARVHGIIPSRAHADSASVFHTQSAGHCKRTGISGTCAQHHPKTMCLDPNFDVPPNGAARCVNLSFKFGRAYNIPQPSWLMCLARDLRDLVTSTAGCVLTKTGRSALTLQALWYISSCLQERVRHQIVERITARLAVLFAVLCDRTFPTGAVHEKNGCWIVVASLESVAARGRPPCCHALFV